MSVKHESAIVLFISYWYQNVTVSVTDTVVERFCNSVWTTIYLFDLLGLFTHQYHVRPESDCHFSLIFLVV